MTAHELIELAAQHIIFGGDRETIRALKTTIPDGVIVPREIYNGALNYIKHIGEDHGIRGWVYPQQWVIDGLESAAQEKP